MLLSVKQRYVMDVLKRLGCIRRDQLYILTRDHFKTEEFTLSENQMDALLRQLPFLVNDIRLENGYVRKPETEPMPLRDEAVDVMLELSNGYPIRFYAVQDSPIVLRFSLGSDPPRRYAVAVYSDTAAAIEPEENVVWISRDCLNPKAVNIAKRQFYAQRQEDGAHRFFGANK